MRRITELVRPSTKFAGLLFFMMDGTISLDEESTHVSPYVHVLTQLR